MKTKASALHWENPLLNPDYVSDLVAIVSPFATAGGLRELFTRIPPPSGLQVITSWTSNTLLGGSADPEVYRVLEEVGGRLYLHDRIHLKLYICSRHQAVLSTGNLTRNGLGFSASPNIEASAFVDLANSDWVNISKLFAESRRVTEEVYQEAVEFCKKHKRVDETLPKFAPPPELVTPGMFSWLSLPATRSPTALWNEYSAKQSGDDPERQARLAHDLAIYGIQEGLTEELFHIQISNHFLKHPFIIKLVEWISLRGTAQFGAVKAWIQQTCSDKPTPYRWQLTPAIQALFDWLAYYHPQIQWNRPNYSQVIQWRSA
jgi:hypothetical protein